ncbi:MAG: GntR family transcriptional regulator [Actinomycetota bacterium]|nr:GntR family transcriptional regulator [Actinomycetota bacterium]MDP9486160.1 GntR family transcriptional regulator [Actinomycetota bacterium]PLS85916.1 MAG: GntR family transcriptional regulator [Actinomycetota bacterium]
MWLDVDPRSGVPIYVQLVEGVRRALEVGTLRPGERLPTVRALAGELTVAPNTVVKAYNELQREGLIESRAGVGTVVVGEAGETMRRRKVEDLYGRVGVLVRDAAGLGITEEDLRERFDRELGRTFKTVGNRGEA